METIPAISVVPWAWARLKACYQYWLSLGPCLWCLQSKCEPQWLCADCQCALPRFSPQMECANLLAYPGVANHIAHKYLDTLLVLSPYQYPINHWISALKFQRRPDYGDLLGVLLGEYLQQLYGHASDQISAQKPPRHAGQKALQPDILVPVPLHWRRLKSRQYNQANLIAQQISKLCNIPLSNTLLTRQQATTAQVGLGGGKRRRNLRGAFMFNPTHPLPEHVAIIDDVVTTGSTVNEIARVLKRHGVKTVSVYCVAISCNL